MGSGLGARYTLVIGLKQGQRVSGGGLLGKGDGGAQSFAGWIRPFSLGGLEGLGRAPTLPLPLVGVGCLCCPLVGREGAAGTASPWLLLDSAFPFSLWGSACHCPADFEVPAGRELLLRGWAMLSSCPLICSHSRSSVSLLSWAWCQTSSFRCCFSPLSFPLTFAGWR